MVRILIVEDDRDLNKAVCKRLNTGGYLTVSCFSVEEAYQAMEQERCDAIISDIMIPGKSGIEFAEDIRTIDPVIPILFMTAYDNVDTMRRGYQIGIDDYMRKPINLDELVMRIGALLRRAHIMSKKKISIGNFELDEETLTAKMDGKEIPVTLREFRLLFTLLSYPDRAFSRMQLLERYNGLDNESTPRSVDVFINGLRMKFAACDSFKIETVRGLGYKAVLK